MLLRVKVKLKDLDDINPERLLKTDKYVIPPEFGFGSNAMHINELTYRLIKLGVTERNWKTQTKMLQRLNAAAKIVRGDFVIRLYNEDIIDMVLLQRATGLKVSNLKGFIAECQDKLNTGALKQGMERGVMCSYCAKHVSVVNTEVGELCESCYKDACDGGL